MVSQEVNIKNSFNDNIKEINEIKPINILSSSINNEFYNSRKSSNSSSLNSED